MGLAGHGSAFTITRALPSQSPGRCPEEEEEGDPARCGQTHPWLQGIFWCVPTRLSSVLQEFFLAGACTTAGPIPSAALPGRFLGTGGIPEGTGGIPEGTNTFPCSAFSQGAPREHGSRRICTSSSALRIIPAWLKSCVRSWLPSKLQVLSRSGAAAPAPSLLHPTL